MVLNTNTVMDAYLTALYAAAVSGTPCNELPPENAGESLLAAAEKHGIVGAVYYPLKETALATAFEQAHTAACQRDTLRAEEEAKVFNAFDKADVSYLPLKGSVLRLYYPSTDMRDMSDIDLMVDQYARKDVRGIMQSCGYKQTETHGNSDIYTAENGVVFEVHFKPKDASAFHRGLMERAIPVSEQGSRLSLSFSDFYVYIISDLATKVTAGKATLRALGDIKVFYSRCGAKVDRQYVESTLKDMGLYVFETELNKLIYALFYGEKASGITPRFASYIYSAGAAVNKKQRKDNKALLVRLGLAYNKNGKQRMAGSDIALAIVVILVLVFAIGFISMAFFQKETNRFNPPSYSGDDSSVDGEQSGEESTYLPPEQDYVTIPYRNGVYKGFVADGLPNGLGELTLPNGERYIGSFGDGLFNGYGIYYYLNGSSYDGVWFEGEINGLGTLTFEDGSYIYGDFVNGTPQGVCVYQNADGDVYEGELKDGQRTGKGRFSWANGDIYEGDYVDGRREGYGKYTHCDGGSYEGEWVDSVPNGSGTMVTDKATLTGVFIQGVLEGEGVSVSKNGDTYKGYFVHGKCNDESAVYTFKDGSKYEGAFVNDVFHGKGKFTYADGDTVTGTFENGLLQGKAKYYDKSAGTTRTVTYKDGKPV